MASPAARLAGFLILLVLMFSAAYAIGTRLGPVTLTHQQPGHGGSMQMGPQSARAPLTVAPYGREAGR